MGNVNAPSKRFLLSALFVIAELALYVIFLARDIAGSGSTVAIKYAGVLLCLVFSAVSTLYSRLDGLTVFVALCFTAISDLFLLVLGRYYEIGLITFIAAQAVYFLRLCLIRGRLSLPSLVLRLTMPAIAIATLAACSLLDLLTALVCVYFPQLVINAAETGLMMKRRASLISFFIGLLLFILCDICVGLYNFRSVLGVTLSPGAYRFVSVGMWAFYLPSQVLIALSVTKS